MAAIEQQIPNMLGGVSQQPDPVKLPGQVRVADNVLLDPTFGCMKRPSTQWVAALEENVPNNARWFPIFRDNVERYMAVIYRSAGKLTVRVWDATNGQEKTVVVDQENWDDYSDGIAPKNFETLSIADYTLICNSKANTSASKVEEEEPPKDALVTIGQVSYNTSYNIDLGTPGADPVVTTRATKVTVSPSSWVDGDETCGFDNAQNFQENDGDGPGVGLTFRLTSQGVAQREEDTKDEYECRYTTRVLLQNGGQGWRVGDEIKVDMSGKGYRIKVEEVEELTAYANLGTATVVTPADATSGGLSVETITNGLVNEINAIGNFEAETVGNVIRITRANNKAFTVTARGGLAGSAMDAIVSTAADVSELPTQCFDEYFLRIVNSDDAEADDYYVKFKSDVPGQPGPGSWIETVNRGDGEYLNPTSMPFALIRQANGDFTLGPLNDDSALGGWAGREVGDSNTNPTPSFIGRPIYGMFLHRNRLGFLTEESVVMSQPGDFFNFYATSGVAISDADPVDLSASDTKPVVLRTALATPQGVMLFGEQAQFRLHSEENTFGPNTAELKKIASYDYQSDADPQLTNVSIMFNSSVGEFTKVYELATASLKGESPVFSENTRTIPRYIPTNVRWSTSCTNNDLVLFGDGEYVYAFRYFNQGDERQVAGWAKWEFDGDVKFVAANGDDLYVIEEFGGFTNLGVMTLVDGPDAPIDVEFSQFRPRVDMQIPSSELTSEPDEILPSGRVVTPYILPDGYVGEEFVGQAAYTDVRTGEYEELLVDSNRILIDAGRSFVFGRKYASTLELPAFYVKTDNRADRISNVMVQRVYLDLYNSGAIQAEIKVRGYEPRFVDLPLIEADSYAASSVVVDEDYTADLDIFQRGDQTSITLISTTPFPTSITSYSWAGQYNKRGYQRI